MCAPPPEPSGYPGFTHHISLIPFNRGSHQFVTICSTTSGSVFLLLRDGVGARRLLTSRTFRSTPRPIRVGTGRCSSWRLNRAEVHARVWAVRWYGFTKLWGREWPCIVAWHESIAHLFCSLETPIVSVAVQRPVHYESDRFTGLRDPAHQTHLRPLPPPSATGSETANYDDTPCIKLPTTVTTPVVFPTS